jgi:hypothetical protein
MGKSKSTKVFDRYLDHLHGLEDNKKTSGNITALESMVKLTIATLTNGLSKAEFEDGTKEREALMAAIIILSTVWKANEIPYVPAGLISFLKPPKTVEKSAKEG